jgi:RNA polymerase sigma-70 factor (ECF subfamily)
METRIETLAGQAKDGSRTAFDQLLEIYRGRLERLIRSRLGEALKRRLDAEDILQDTLLRAFCSIGRLEWRGEEAFFSWLGTLAEHVIASAAERKSPPAPLRNPWDVPASRVAPSRALRREERFERLRDSLAALPPDHREVILLARIERLSFQEIGERMGRSSEAAKMLLARALKGLKRGFGHTESLHLPQAALGSDGEAGHGG